MAEDFDLCFKAVKNLLGVSKGFKLPDLKAMYESITVRDKKSVFDLAFRDRMLELLSINSNESIKTLLKMSVAAAVAEICSAATPFLLFADLFNTKPIVDAEENFQFMEKTITALKDVSLFGPGRNVLLRMCNDLLRRLSKSQNTIFCGMIQLFLTRLFPLDEKSGLNLMSNFNSEKEISYNQNPDENLFQSIIKSTSSEEESKPSDTLGDLKVNAKLYRKFWSLQEYLKSPVLCYTKDGWENFSNCSDSVIETFSSIRINDNFDSERRWQTNGVKFTMYLTSEKLFDLQLMDANFRRYILVQLLITFQYLSAQVKFKNTVQNLTDSQLKWVKSHRDAVAKLLGGCPESTESDNSAPITPSFRVVNHILDRETHWNRWKNEGCSSFIRNPEKSSLVGKSLLVVKRRTNLLVDRSGNKIYRFGNRDLDKLWSASPDNLEACTDQKRLFRPDLLEHFKGAIVELNPEEKVEEEYKLINSEEWTWRSLRLLSRRCSYFYTNWNPPGRPIKDYLQIILTEKLQSEEEKNAINGDAVKSYETSDAPSSLVKSNSANVLTLKSTQDVASGRTNDRRKIDEKNSSSRVVRSRSSGRSSNDNLNRLTVTTLFGTGNNLIENLASMSRLSDTDGEADDIEDEDDDENNEDEIDEEERGAMEIN